MEKVSFLLAEGFLKFREVYLFTALLGLVPWAPSLSLCVAFLNLEIHTYMSCVIILLPRTELMGIGAGASRLVQRASEVEVVEGQKSFGDGDLTLLRQNEQVVVKIVR